MIEPSVLAAVEWDAVTWGRALTWAVRQSGRLRRGMRVLEVGGRTGALARWLASRGACVVSIDIMGERPVNWTFPEEGKVHAGKGDVLALPDGFECDLVVLKSVLGAIGGRGGIEAQAEACRRMVGAVRHARGEVWILENLAASPLHKLLRRRFVPWNSGWRYVTIEELLGFFGTGSVAARGFGLAATFGRREWQRRTLGRFDAVLLERLAPPSWRYVAAIVARPSGAHSIEAGGASDGGERWPLPRERRVR